MATEHELAAQIQRVVNTFGRKAERDRLKATGHVRVCRGCGGDVVSRGRGRPSSWCPECRKPGGVYDAHWREYQRVWAAKMYALVKNARGDR